MASAVRLMVSEVSLVMWSPTVPLSVVKPLITGGAAVVSIVTARLVEAALVLPAMSVSVAVSAWLPLDRVELVIDQLPELSATALPSDVVPLVSNRVTVAPASAPLPVNTGVVTLVMLSVLDEPEVGAAALLDSSHAVTPDSVFTFRV